MFGFGKAKLVRKMRDEVKGMTLSEVVEKYGDAEAISPPKLRYDPELVAELENQVKDISLDDVLGACEVVQEYCAKNGLDEEALLMFIAKREFYQLRMYSVDLAAAAKLVPSNKFSEYFFGTWLHNVPSAIIVPILFPPKNAGKIEDFWIDTEKRNQLIDTLFDRIPDVGFFKNLINDFVQEHRYFRIYPNV